MFKTNIKRYIIIILVMFEVGNKNFYNINLNRNRNNYKISFGKSIFNNEKLILKSPIMSVPFGVEKYLSKLILNLEFTNKDKNNEMNNFYATLKQIDNFMYRLSWDEELINESGVSIQFVKDIYKKQYVSCIRNRNKYDSLFRTHIRKTKNSQTTEFYRIEDNNRIYLLNDEIHKQAGEFEIELDFVWITKDSYGLTWYIKNGLIK
jgi:hypothetical protein